jgi:hypothetical protein
MSEQVFGGPEHFLSRITCKSVGGSARIAPLEHKSDLRCSFCCKEFAKGEVCHVKPSTQGEFNSFEVACDSCNTRLREKRDHIIRA